MRCRCVVGVLSGWFVCVLSGWFVCVCCRCVCVCSSGDSMFLVISKVWTGKLILL